MLNMTHQYAGAGQCKKACCWTPGLGCARGYQCAHHAAAAAQEERADRDAQMVEDLGRAEHIAARRRA